MRYPNSTDNDSISICSDNLFKIKMTLVDELKSKWSEKGLIDKSGNIAPTFIEEVGSAAAENVRSAALKRWFNNNPEKGVSWLKNVISKDLSGDAPYSMIREYKLDKNSRVDLVVQDKKGINVAFIEVKWISVVKHDDQLAVYRNLIDKDHAAVPLIILSPIEHARPVGGKKFDLISAKWSDLTDYLKRIDSKENSLELDLWRSVFRLKSIEDLLRKSIDENRAVGDFFELDDWLNEKNKSNNKSEGLSELFRHIFFTLLSEKACSNFQKLDSSACWRRSATSNGEQSSDIQSDVSPENFNDGLIIVKKDLDKKIAVFLRFHSRAEFDAIDVSIGTSFIPYISGGEKAEWKNKYGENWELIKRQMHEVRYKLAQNASDRGLRGMRNCKINGENWFQKLVDINFNKKDVKVSEVLDYAARLRDFVTDTVKEHSL